MAQILQIASVHQIGLQGNNSGTRNELIVMSEMGDQDKPGYKGITVIIRIIRKHNTQQMKQFPKRISFCYFAPVKLSSI